MKPGRKSNIAPETKLIIADMYNAGAKIRDIQDVVHIRANTISTIVFSLGIQRPRTNTERNEKILQLAHEGKTQKEIADIIGIDQSLVCNVFLKNGIRTYNKRTHTNNRINQSVEQEEPPIPIIPERKPQKPPERIYDKYNNKWYIDVPIDNFFDYSADYSAEGMM